MKSYYYVVTIANVLTIYRPFFPFDCNKAVFGDSNRKSLC